MKHTLGEVLVVLGRSLVHRVHYALTHRCRPGPPERDDAGKLYYPCPECSRKKYATAELVGRGANRCD
jgi:hypothetical protein